MKNGILLSGGTGTRLLPITKVINKHLLGLNGKLVIDYPIETLKSMGCENVTIILGGAHFSQVAGYLEDGHRYDMNFNYIYQGEPKGIAHAISLCKKMVADDSEFAVVLGDNVFEKPVQWRDKPGTAQIALAQHPELHRFGVCSMDVYGKIVNIEEKPQHLQSSQTHLAITGCYKFTEEYFDFFEKISPSARGEFEITDIIKQYLAADKLSWVETSGLWSDAGTHESIGYINNYFYNKG